MDSRTQERVEEWDSRPFSGGYDGLSELATADFSGAVTAAGSWLFMLNGRVIGVIDGEIEDFENASGTRYDAPDPSLPLLCVMECRGGEPRAKYYTNETPLREVDQTLQDGSFTGYIELSENVLSGDYYVVYYGGRRMAAAYIGNANRLRTGDEAFDRAADEVGIYTVTDVEIEVTDVPGTDTSTETEETTASETESATAGTQDSISELDDDSTTGADVDEPITGLDSEDSRTESDNDSSITALSSGDELAGSDDEDAVTALGPDDPLAGSSDEDSVTALDSDDPLAGSNDEDAVTALDSDDPLADSTEDESVTALSSGDPLASSDDEDPVTALDSGGSDADSVADRTASTESAMSIDPIEETEIGGTGDDSTGADEGASIGDDLELTGEVSGITTTESDLEPQSPGITDVEPSTTSLTDPEDGAEPASEGESADDHQPDDGDDADSLETDDGAETDDQPGNAIKAVAERVADETPGPEDGETAVEAPLSGADPDVIEAAAEELDQSDISWTDTDGNRSPLDDTADESEPTEAGGDALDEQLQEEAQWQSVQTIPSIDPDNTAVPTPQSTTEAADEAVSRTDGNGSVSADSSGRDNGSESGQYARPDRPTQRSQTGGDDRASAEAQRRIEELTEQLETVAKERDRATEQRDEAIDQRDRIREQAVELKTERDQYRSKTQELAATIEELQSRIDELEAELDRARTELAEANTDEQSEDGPSTELQPRRALSETNLFVRYRSKSQPTLETAHDGEADHEDVVRNLRVEHHTGFDAADVAVDGKPYTEFLESTMAYQFINWLTDVLLYEIRDTDHASQLVDLYDAIPQIDRIELHASISLADDETEDVPDEVTFDLVAYDKMGSPLLVADLNDSRSPASEAMLESMEANASAVKANYPTLAAAMVVTSSYFEPGALEIAETATSNGFLSRGSKLSYVNLSRKTGYHLCLVESRSEGFHMNVPEL